MSEKSFMTKPVAAAVGAAFVSSMAASTAVVAADNPFEATDLDSGYMLADGHKAKEGKCGEGKCGGEKAKEGKCGFLQYARVLVSEFISKEKKRRAKVETTQQAS